MILFCLVIILFILMPIKLKNKTMGLLYCYLTYFIVTLCVHRIFIDVSPYFDKYNGDIFVWGIFSLFLILWIIQRESPYRFLWVLFFLPTIVSYGHDWDGAYDAYLFFRPYGYVLLSLFVKIEDNLSPLLSLIKFSYRDCSSYFVAVLEMVSVFVNTIIGFIVFLLYRNNKITNLDKSSDSVGFSHIMVAIVVFVGIVILSYCNIQLFQAEEQSTIITFLNHQLVSAASLTIFLVAIILFFKSKKTKIYIVSFFLVFLCTPTFVSLKFINGAWGEGYWDFYTPFYCMKSIGIQIVSLSYFFVSKNDLINLNKQSILTTIELGCLLLIPFLYSMVFIFRNRIHSFLQTNKNAISDIFDEIIYVITFSLFYAVIVAGIFVLFDSYILDCVLTIVFWSISLALILKKKDYFDKWNKILYIFFLVSFPVITMRDGQLGLCPWGMSLWKTIVNGRLDFEFWNLLNLAMMITAVIVLHYMKVRKNKNYKDIVSKYQINNI